MSITGNIKTFHLSSLLQLLSNDKKTGILELTDGNDNVQIYLSEGTIINAFGSSRVERLTNYLCSEGIITTTQLEDSLEVSVQTGKKIGKVLVEKGHISQEKLESLLKQQIEQTLFSIFLWEQGDFEYRDQELDLSGQIITNFDTMQIVLEASRRCDEISETKKRVPPDNELLVISPDANEQQLMRLNTAERAVLSLINGKRTVKRVIVDSGYAELKVYKILFSLITSGLIMKEEKTSEISSATVFKRQEDKTTEPESISEDTQEPDTKPDAEEDTTPDEEEPSDVDELVLELEPEEDTDTAEEDEQTAADEFLKDLAVDAAHPGKPIVKVDGQLLPDIDEDEEYEEEAEQVDTGQEKAKEEEAGQVDVDQKDMTDLVDTIKLEPSSKEQEAKSPSPSPAGPADRTAEERMTDYEPLPEVALPKRRLPSKPLLFTAAVVTLGAALLLLKPFFFPEIPEQQPVQQQVSRKVKKPLKATEKKPAGQTVIQKEGQALEPETSAEPQEPSFTFFQDKKGWISINLPSGYTTKETSFLAMARVVIRYGDEITLIVTIIPETADWNAEEEMYAEIVRMQDYGNNQVQQYHTLKHAGCPGYVLKALGEHEHRTVQKASYRFACFNKNARLKITNLNRHSAEVGKLYQQICTAIEETFLIYR